MTSTALSNAAEDFQFKRHAYVAKKFLVRKNGGSVDVLVIHFDFSVRQSSIKSFEHTWPAPCAKALDHFVVQVTVPFLDIV